MFNNSGGFNLNGDYTVPTRMPVRFAYPLRSGRSPHPYSRSPNSDYYHSYYQTPPSRKPYRQLPYLDYIPHSHDSTRKLEGGNGLPTDLPTAVENTSESPTAPLRSQAETRIHYHYTNIYHGNNNRTNNGVTLRDSSWSEAREEHGPGDSDGVNSCAESPSISDVNQSHGHEQPPTSSTRLSPRPEPEKRRVDPKRLFSAKDFFFLALSMSNHLYDGLYYHPSNGTGGYRWSSPPKVDCHCTRRCTSMNTTTTTSSSVSNSKSVSTSSTDNFYEQKRSEAYSCVSDLTETTSSTDSSSVLDTIGESITTITSFTTTCTTTCSELD